MQAPVIAASPPMAAHILVIEDDPLQADSLAFILGQEGYAVVVAQTAHKGLDIARSSPTFDLVLLDLALPDLSGVEVARRLRAGSAVPIILLTARRQETDKITGLDAGADDYITKPFSPGELLARVRAQLRRQPRERSSVREFGTYQVGPLRIDVGTRQVLRGASSIDLSAREFEIVRVLAEAAGRVVERGYLFRHVWGADFFGDERALDVYIRMIRKKIEPEPSRPQYLHTLRGVGYRLAALGFDAASGEPS